MNCIRLAALLSPRDEEYVFLRILLDAEQELVYEKLGCWSDEKPPFRGVFWPVGLSATGERGVRGKLLAADGDLRAGPPVIVLAVFRESFGLDTRAYMMDRYDNYYHGKSKRFES